MDFSSSGKIQSLLKYQQSKEMNTIQLLISFLFCPVFLLAQTAEEQAYNDQYERNIQLEYINEVYIPLNVDEALEELDRLSDEGGREKFLEAEENLVADRLIYGLGKWMTVNWNFYEGSRLSHHLKEYGLSHPEDMAHFLIVTYHRHLRQAPLDLRKRGSIYFEKRKKEQESRNLQKRIIDG